jgi:hypothetical protein
MTRSQRYQQRIRQRALENLGGKCALCDCNQHLEIHHTAYDGWNERLSGHTRSHVLRASKGDIQGLACLCKNCHQQETLKTAFIFKQTELKKLEQRYYFCIGGD